MSEHCPSPEAPNGVHLGSPCDFCGVARHVSSCPRKSGANYCWCAGAPEGAGA